LRRAGFDVKGWDISSTAVETGRAAFGLDLTCGLLPAESESFDVVLLRHVVEHVADPEAMTRALSRNLGSSGVLIVATPNFRSWTARTFGRDWYWVDPPAHLQYFTGTSLAKLLSNSEYRVESISCRRGDFPDYPSALTAMFLKRVGLLAAVTSHVGGLTTRRGGMRGVVRDFAIALARVVDVVVFRGPEVILNLAGLSEELWAVARRRPARPQEPTAR
jgi:SAM-dependent methyltransferase